MLSLLFCIEIDRSIGNIFELIFESLLFYFFKKISKMFENNIFEAFLKRSDWSWNKDTFRYDIKSLTCLENR